MPGCECQFSPLPANMWDASGKIWSFFGFWKISFFMRCIFSCLRTKLAPKDVGHRPTIECLHCKERVTRFTLEGAPKIRVNAKPAEEEEKITSQGKKRMTKKVRGIYNLHAYIFIPGVFIYFFHSLYYVLRILNKRTRPSRKNSRNTKIPTV